MTIPADQDSRPARTLQGGDWVWHEGRWVAIADAVTTDGRTVVTLAPLTYDADENVAVCAPLVIADPKVRTVR